MKYKIMFYGGLLLILISIILFWRYIQEKNIYERSELVTLEIIESPDNCNNISTRGGYCTLKYNNDTLVKRAGNKFCLEVSN